MTLPVKESSSSSSFLPSSSTFEFGQLNASLISCVASCDDEREGMEPQRHRRQWQWQRQRQRQQRRRSVPSSYANPALRPNFFRSAERWRETTNSATATQTRPFPSMHTAVAIIALALPSDAAKIVSRPVEWIHPSSSAAAPSSMPWSGSSSAAAASAMPFYLMREALEVMEQTGADRPGEGQ